MAFLVRKAGREDAAELAGLLGEYMRETYGGEWGGDEEVLGRDLAANEIGVLVAETTGSGLVAFLAWLACYDLHWCMKGGTVVDLYVSPPFRSRGVAVLLAIELAKAVKDLGGKFITGGAVESPAVHRLYRRIAVPSGGDNYTVSGRGFRHLAALAGKNVRDIARDLPKPEWSREP